jgi:hypothetical protein
MKSIRQAQTGQVIAAGSFSEEAGLRFHQVAWVLLDHDGTLHLAAI